MGAPKHPHQRPTRGSGVAVILAIVVIGGILGVLALGALFVGWSFVLVDHTVETIERVEVAAEPLEAGADELATGAIDAAPEPAESP